MTLAELCFIVAALAFVVDAVPLIGIAFPFKLQPAGLALAALGLALERASPRIWGSTARSCERFSRSAGTPACSRTTRAPGISD